MKKIILFLAYCLLTGLQLFSQNINNLNFNYQKGFCARYKGELVYYDKYNFPDKRVTQYYEYQVIDEKPVKNGKNLRFLVKIITGIDTVTLRNTWCTINDKGMKIVINEKQKEYRKKHATQAISLPLYKGRFWKTYLNDMPAIATCISTDTVISTIKGKFTCFVIEYQVDLPRIGDYQKTFIVREFYAHDFAKVRFEELSSIYYFNTKETYTIVRSEFNIE